MNLVELSEADKITFDRFVATHPGGSFLQSWKWGEWQEQLGRQVIRVMIRDGDDVLLAAQIIRMPVPIMHGYYLYIPYGPLIRSEELGIRNEVTELLVKKVLEKFPDTAFIRIEPKENLQLTDHPSVLSPHIQPGKTLLIDLQQPEERLLAAMHPKTRYNIRVAQRHGVVVQSELIVTPGHGLLLKEVLDLLVETAVRQGYKGFPAGYYRNLIDFFGLQARQGNCNLTIYKALLGQELLAAGLMIDFGYTRTYLFGGTNSAQRSVMAPYVLHWQAISDAKKQGLQHYDFWGIETAGGQTPGFVRFKLGWGGAQQSYPPAADIIQKPLWYTVYKGARTINRIFNS